MHRHAHTHTHTHTHTCKHRNIKILNIIKEKQMQYKKLDLVAYSQLIEFAKLLQR